MKTLIWNLETVNQLRGDKDLPVILGLIDSMVDGGKGQYISRDGDTVTVTYGRTNVVLKETDDAYYVIRAYWRYDN